MKNSISEKCSETLCARMPYTRRSHFSRHFLSSDFGAFHAKLDFFNSHRPFHSKPLPGGFESNGDFATNETRRCSSGAKAFLVPHGSIEDEIVSNYSDGVLPECGAFVTDTLHFRVGAWQSQLSALRPVAEWRRPRQNRNNVLNIAWVLACRL